MDPKVDGRVSLKWIMIRYHVMCFDRSVLLEFKDLK